MSTSHWFLKRGEIIKYTEPLLNEVCYKQVINCLYIVYQCWIIRVAVVFHLEQKQINKWKISFLLFSFFLSFFFFLSLENEIRNQLHLFKTWRHFSFLTLPFMFKTSGLIMFILWQTLSALQFTNNATMNSKPLVNVKQTSKHSNL